MTLLSLDMPSDAKELALWLESHLVGHTLGQLVSELAAAHGRQRDFQIDHLINNCRSELLNQGLQTLTGKQLLLLIKNPSLLGDLQELILTDGGPYWQSQLRATWKTNPSYQQGMRVLNNLSGSESVEPKVAQPDRFQPQGWAIRLLTTSALLLIGFLGWQLFSPLTRSSATWGWNNPQLFRTADSSLAYFTKLAEAADEWFNERPDTPAALSRRIKELRTGCNRLIAAEHSSLSAIDREWLVGRCRVWAAKIDDSLAELEAGSTPQAVRAQVDLLIRKLSDTLRTRQPSIACFGWRRQDVLRPGTIPIFNSRTGHHSALPPGLSTFRHTVKSTLSSPDKGCLMAKLLRSFVTITG